MVSWWRVALAIIGLLVADGRIDGCTAVACKDRQVQEWDLPVCKLLAVLQGHGDKVKRVCISTDGRCAASYGHDGLTCALPP